MLMDELLYRIADRVKNFAVIYVCDIDEVPDFNKVIICFYSEFCNLELIGVADV